MDILLGAISGAKTIQLVTYKRDGTAVATPVSVAVAGDRAFFRTYDQAGKARRLRGYRTLHYELLPAPR
jgi:uncharacterized protein